MKQVRLYARSRPATSEDREAALFGTRPCGVPALPERYCRNGAAELKDFYPAGFTAKQQLKLAAPKHTIPSADVFNTALYQQAACCGVSAYAANPVGRQMRVTRVTLGSFSLSDHTAADTLRRKHEKTASKSGVQNTSAVVACESVQSCLDLEEYMAAQNSSTQEPTQQQAPPVMQWSREGNRPNTAVLQLPECKLSEELQSHASTVSNLPNDAQHRVEQQQQQQQHQQHQQQQQQQWAPAVQRRREKSSSVKPYTPLVCIAPQLLPDDASAAGTAPPELSADAAAVSLATRSSVLSSSQRSTATTAAAAAAANECSSLNACKFAAATAAAGAPTQHSSSAAVYAQFVCAVRDVLLAVVRREDLLCCCNSADFSSAKAAAVPVLVPLSMRAAAAHRAVARCGLYCDTELQAAAAKEAVQLEYYSAAAARYACSTLVCYTMR
jgi:hypothetical protein